VDPLDDLLARLYAAFSDEPRPTSVPRCEHCFSDVDEAELLADIPLRELSTDVVGLYARNAAADTVGGPPDLKYFLPRIVELAVDEAGFMVDVEHVTLVVARLRLAGWRGDQCAALGEVLCANWLSVLGGPEIDADNLRALDTVLDLTGSVASSLETWAARLGEPGPAALLLAYAERLRADRDDPWTSAFEPSEIDVVLSDWLCSDGLRQRIRACVRNTDDAAVRDCLALALALTSR
jgi:hypothetical protein